MYTQNGSPDRHVEALIVEVIWPEFIAQLERDDYRTSCSCRIRFVDFTAGYDTNSAVLFPETVAMREIPTFTWGAIFQDREAARYRASSRPQPRSRSSSCPPTPRAARRPGAHRADFVMWDLIHDRTHMRGDLPFDPFMIKQRMPYFLYSLEELRCDLTAFREAVRTALRDEATDERHARPRPSSCSTRSCSTGSSASRSPAAGCATTTALGGQLLFAWLHQHRVLHWTDTRLAIDWDSVADVVVALATRSTSCTGSRSTGRRPRTGSRRTSWSARP